ncbi:Transmembrane protein 160 [Trichoplax sp. H2]|nr:Transmembrane protein 160 [Trichoplax sp. H2]|eukprot:RDD37044.1 Transmembrane protein 160 [Trichoplax sp. H2]
MPPIISMLYVARRLRPTSSLRYLREFNTSTVCQKGIRANQAVLPLSSALYPQRFSSIVLWRSCSSFHSNNDTKAAPTMNSTSSSPDNKQSINKESLDVTKLAALSLQKANENGYLSWGRNGLLFTAISLSLYNSDIANHVHAVAASLVFASTGVLCISSGTIHYIWDGLKLRRQMLISRFRLIWMISHASCILSFWILGLLFYFEDLLFESAK